MSASPRTTGSTGLAIAAIAVVLLLALAGFLVIRQLVGPNAARSSGPPPTDFTTVSYTSSVDGFALSFAEWLPSGATQGQSYPLVVYLHGQQDTSGRWFSGGLTSELVQAIENSSDPTNQMEAQSLVSAAATHGAILIAVNTRSGSGWYINSLCGGPQEQDVLDAINVEKSRHHIGQVFLMGESMGTEGTLFIASQNPGLFSGVAVVAAVTDLYEDVYYRMSLANTPGDAWAAVSIQAKAHLFCGVLPGTGNASQMSVARMFQNMSPLRFDPQAFAGVPLYMDSGGVDNRAPNNVSIWPTWMNANNTLVNATCNYVPSLGEPVPPSCSTQTFESLHRQDPGQYTFRFVFEPQAGHSLTELDAADLMGFWFGSLPGGYYLGAASSTTVTPAPGLSY